MMRHFHQTGKVSFKNEGPDSNDVTPNFFAVKAVVVLSKFGRVISMDISEC